MAAVVLFFHCLSAINLKPFGQSVVQTRFKLEPRRAGETKLVFDLFSKLLIAHMSLSNPAGYS